MAPITFALCGLVAFCNLCHGQTSLADLGLDYGAFRVGFAHYTLTDSTRTYQRIYDYSNEILPRPIPVSMWYPAQEKATVAESLKVLDYFKILKEEEEWESLPDEQLLNWFYYQNTPSNQSHLRENTRAFYNVKAADKTFPVVVYAPSYQASSIENFALCEYLASHGYIVISSPSRGTETRWFGANHAKEMETQARDVELLVKEAWNYPEADLDRMGVMGFSFGGLSNTLAQMRNSNIKVVVSLDGTERYRAALLQESPFFNFEKMDVPYLHMAQKEIPEIVLREDGIDPVLNTRFELYDSITKSEAYSLRFNHLTHSYFSTLGVLFEQRDPRQDKSDPEIMESYKWVAVYSKRFLDAYLKDDPGGLIFMENSPAENGVPEGLIHQQSKRGEIPDFSFLDFNELAAAQSYENLDQLYESSIEKNPDLMLPEGFLNTLGLQLVFDPNTSEQGINVLLLGTKKYPNSANLFDSLAEGYLFVGNEKKALENFQKSLELNPQNQNAIARLKEIQN